MRREDCRPSSLSLSLLPAVIVGTQLSWAVQAAYGTPTFLTLGASERAIGLLKAAGPVTGLLCQPLAGALVAREGGRAIVMVIWGAVLCIVGLGILSLGARSHSLLLAAGALWLIDSGFNFADIAMRIVAAEVGSREQQTRANGAIASCLGAGQILGFLAGGFLGKFLRSLGFHDADDLSAVSLFGMVLTALGLGASCLIYTRLHGRYRALASGGGGGSDVDIDGDESNKVEEESELLIDKRVVVAADDEMNAKKSGQGLVQVFLRLYDFANLPDWFYRLAAITSISWVAWFVFLLFGTHWMGEHVFGGNPGADEGIERERYEEGVRWGNLGLAGNAVVTMIVSQILPLVARYMSEWRIYSCSILLEGLLLAATNFVTYGMKVRALLIFISLGIPWSSSMSLPFAIIGKEATSESVSSLLVKINVFVVLPQILVVFLVAFIGSLQTLLMIGGITGIMGGIVGLWLCRRIDYN